MCVGANRQRATTCVVDPSLVVILNVKVLLRGAEAAEQHEQADMKSDHAVAAGGIASIGSSSAIDTR